VALTLALCLPTVGLQRVFGVSSQDATATIASADHALQAAFVNVSDTERAGVNVSGLLSRLDEAGLALAMAEAASNSGDFSEAVNQAAVSEAAADSVARDALALKSGAEGWSSNVLFSFEDGFLGVGVFVVVLALTWLWFKRYYGRKLSKSRPEVTA
jgi:hypothetical protein